MSVDIVFFCKLHFLRGIQVYGGVYRPCHKEILGIPYEGEIYFCSILKDFNFV